MNHSIIQDQSDINSFYAKIYSIVGVGIGISAIVSLLMLNFFQDIIISVLTGSTWIFYAAIAVEFILVLVASGTARSNSPAALPMFSLFSHQWFYLKYYHGAVSSVNCSLSLSDNDRYVLCHGLHRQGDQEGSFWNGQSLYGRFDWYYRC